MNDDMASRLERLETKLGFKDSREPLPPGGSDQLIASYLLGLEAGLKEARGTKDKAQADLITVEMTARLGALSPERRKVVQAIMAHDRPLRGQPGPKLVDVVPPYGSVSTAPRRRVG